MKQTAHQRPSRIKYEKSHPVVSVRVSRETYEEFKNLTRMSGKSPGDVLREALGKQIPSAKNAYERGYKDARDIFSVSYHCYICGGQTTLQSKQEREAAAQYMKDHGWSHAECKSKRESTPKPRMLGSYTIMKPPGGGPPITKFVEVDPEALFVLVTP